MEREKTWHKFWSSFGWKAYDETDIPDDATFPYITYSLMTGNLEAPVYPSISLWDRSTGWTSVTEKKDEIANRIGYGGIVLPIKNEGFLWIVQGTPFAQRSSDDDNSVRRITINVAANFLTAV